MTPAQAAAKIHERNAHGFPVELNDTAKGFGDTIAKITKKVGIKTCGGCQKRRKTLNKMFPYKDK